mgnify:CR=1 FL=1
MAQALLLEWLLPIMWDLRRSAGLALTKNLLSTVNETERNHPVLVLVGSSNSARGIDVTLLSQELEKLGMPICVKQFTVPGFFCLRARLLSGLLFQAAPTRS